MGSDKFAPFQDLKYINLETYRKNGQAVKTPVWFVVSNGIIYVTTTSSTGKVKRLKQNKTVRIVSSNFKGDPKGKWIEGIAHFANEFESGQTITLRKKKYGLLANLVNMYTSRKGKQIVIGIKI